MTSSSSGNSGVGSDSCKWSFLIRWNTARAATLPPYQQFSMIFFTEAFDYEIKLQNTSIVRSHQQKELRGCRLLAGWSKRSMA